MVCFIKEAFAFSWHVHYHEWLPMCPTFINRRNKTKEGMINEIELSHSGNVHDPNWEQATFEMEGVDTEEECDLPEDIKRLLERKDQVIIPSEDPVESLNLGTVSEPKELRIGTLLAPEVRSRLTKLLKEYVDVFAWLYEDMARLATEIVQHQLPLNPECKPV